MKIPRILKANLPGALYVAVRHRCDMQVFVRTYSVNGAQ